MTGPAASMPPTASAALGDGCTRTAGSMHGSDTLTLARIAQIRGGACPAPASMMPLAGSCCEHPTSRAAQQLAKLSGLETHRAALSSTSWAPEPAAVHRLAGTCAATFGSASRDGHQLQPSSSNSSGRTACIRARRRRRQARDRCGFWPVSGRAGNVMHVQRTPEGAETWPLTTDF